MSWSHFVGPFGWSVTYPLTGPEPHHLLRTSPRSFLGSPGVISRQKIYTSPSKIDGHAHSSHINYWCGMLMKHEPIFKIISQATRVAWKTRWWPCNLSHHVTSLVQRWSHDTYDNLQAYVFTLCLIYIHMCIMCEHYRCTIFDDLSIEESTRGGLGSGSLHQCSSLLWGAQTFHSILLESGGFTWRTSWLWATATPQEVFTSNLKFMNRKDDVTQLRRHPLFPAPEPRGV